VTDSQPTIFTLGKYRLIAELGRGGMAEVFLAVANSRGSFAKLVVIKRPREHLAKDVEFMTMLLDEARIAARLNHPNLVQTIEVSEANGEQFLTMEYLDGQPLYRILNRQRATFPTDMYLGILADVCTGIHYAHELKDFDGTPLRIVHRDVTPHNVFVTYEGQVKVVDFGIAKAVGRAGETRHGVVKGKTPYMAPEQAAGREVDRRADIFSVGVMLFEAAARRRMWKGVSEIEIIRRLVAGNIPSSPRAVDPTVDEVLDGICRRCLAVNPDDRYPTAADLQEDLEAYLAQTGRPSSRAIGGYCAELFADKREMTHRIIEKQLAFLKSAPSQANMVQVGSSSEKTLDDSDGILITFDDIPSDPRSGSLSAKSAGGASAPSGSTDPPVRKSASRSVQSQTVRAPLLTRPVLLVAIIVALSTTAITVVALGLFLGRQTPTQGSAKESITVTLRATPLETRFVIDDGPPLDNPFIGKYQRDAQQHKIEAKAPGYTPNVDMVVFDSDMSLRFALSADAPKK
jgi:eukaryotic-like serine/threonine-protein kinase